MKAVQDAASCKSMAEELLNMQIADVETMESPGLDYATHPPDHGGSMNHETH
jgi:hypothetical protein